MLFLATLFCLASGIFYVLNCCIAATQFYNDRTEYAAFLQQLGKPNPTRLSVFLRANGLLDPRYYLTKINQEPFRRRLVFGNILIALTLFAFFVSALGLT